MKFLSWERFPIVYARRSNYELLADGARTGIRVMWCGHPTALRPYYVSTPRENILGGRAYRTAKLAQAAAVEHFGAFI